MPNLRNIYFKIRSIAIGWFAYLFKPKSQMAQDRLAICDRCSYRKGYFCGKCGCVLAAKAEVEDEKCPVGQWL